MRSLFVAVVLFLAFAAVIAMFDRAARELQAGYQQISPEAATAVEPLFEVYKKTAARMLVIAGTGLALMVILASFYIIRRGGEQTTYYGSYGY